MWKEFVDSLLIVLPDCWTLNQPSSPVTPPDKLLNELLNLREGIIFNYDLKNLPFMQESVADKGGELGDRRLGAPDEAPISLVLVCTCKKFGEAGLCNFIVRWLHKRTYRIWGCKRTRIPFVFCKDEPNENSLLFAVI
jgi:hypothetical protein